MKVLAFVLMIAWPIVAVAQQWEYRVLQIYAVDFEKLTPIPGAFKKEGEGM